MPGTQQLVLAYNGIPHGAEETVERGYYNREGNFPAFDGLEEIAPLDMHIGVFRQRDHPVKTVTLPGRKNPSCARSAQSAGE